MLTCPARGTHFSASVMLIYLERPASALAPFHQEPTAPKEDFFPFNLGMWMKGSSLSCGSAQTAVLGLRWDQNHDVGSGPSSGGQGPGGAARVQAPLLVTFVQESRSGSGRFWTPSLLLLQVALSFLCGSRSAGVLKARTAPELLLRVSMQS